MYIGRIPDILKVDAFVDVILLMRPGLKNLALVVGETVTLEAFARQR